MPRWEDLAETERIERLKSESGIGMTQPTPGNPFPGPPTGPGAGDDDARRR